MEERLEQVKWAFYQWLGALSVDEILSNSALIESVKTVERLLKMAKVGASLAEMPGIRRAKPGVKEHHGA